MSINFIVMGAARSPSSFQKLAKRRPYLWPKGSRRSSNKNSLMKTERIITMRWSASLSGLPAILKMEAAGKSCYGLSNPHCIERNGLVETKFTSFTGPGQDLGHNSPTGRLICSVFIRSHKPADTRKLLGLMVPHYFFSLIAHSHRSEHKQSAAQQQTP